MKAFPIALAVFVLLLSLILSAWLNKAQAEGRPIPPQIRSSSVSSMASTSQAIKDLQPDKKHPYKKINSSFRRIPPSTSNPTQNKSKPSIRE